MRRSPGQVWAGGLPPGLPGPGTDLEGSPTSLLPSMVLLPGRCVGSDTSNSLLTQWVRLSLCCTQTAWLLGQQPALWVLPVPWVDPMGSAPRGRPGLAGDWEPICVHACTRVAQNQGGG